MYNRKPFFGAFLSLLIGAKCLTFPIFYDL